MNNQQEITLYQAIRYERKHLERVNQHAKEAQEELELLIIDRKATEKRIAELSEGIDIEKFDLQAEQELRNV